MRIIGIDYSSKAVDFVSLDAYTDQPPVWERFELAGQDAFDRTRDIGFILPSRGSAYWDNVLAVGIEEPRGRNSAPIHRAQGAILSNIPTRVLVQPWLPNEWRAQVGLSGNASHEQYVRRSLCIWPDERWPEDAHAAHLIAHATRTKLRQQEAA